MEVREEVQVRVVVVPRYADRSGIHRTRQEPGAVAVSEEPRKEGVAASCAVCAETVRKQAEPNPAVNSGCHQA